VQQAPRRLWVGIDAGKGHHWAVAVDSEGHPVLSRKVVNDEAQILELLTAVREMADEVIWAVDLTSAAAALLLAVLVAHGQHVLYVPGRAVNRMSGIYKGGEAKTDAKDAHVIADQARMRRDFQAITAPPALVAELALLTEHRKDLVADRTRLYNRLRDLLLGISPALERAFDWSKHRGAVILLTGLQTPAQLRAVRRHRLVAWLAKRGVNAPQAVADTAIEAAGAQHTTLPGEATAARLVKDLAERILALDESIDDVERQVREAFRAHPQAKIIESLPGMGPILGAELLAAVIDLARFPDAGHLATYAGLAPVPRDSGRRTGNLHRPKRYNRTLLRAFYLAAQSAMIRPGPSRDYYLRKRAEGCNHKQAILALARRRVDVLWAMLRDNQPYTPIPARPNPA
jgi:transposase